MVATASRVRQLALGVLVALPAVALAADFTMKIGFGTINDIQHQWANWYK